MAALVSTKTDQAFIMQAQRRVWGRKERRREIRESDPIFGN